MQLTEISSLNNRVYRTLGSSVIIPQKDAIEIVPKRVGVYTISIDNKTVHYKNVTKIEYSIDEKVLTLFQLQVTLAFGNVLTMLLSENLNIEI